MWRLLALLCLTTSCLHGYELAIAAIFKNEGRFLQEWIEYHRMVGVEHFWLYNDLSTDNYEEVLRPYVQEGVVEIIDWPIPCLAKWIEYQLWAYADAISNTRGLTKWLALIDLDEYLLPREEATVTACLEKHFPHAVAVYINWRNFGTGGVSLQENQSVLFGLQSCSESLHSRNAVGKSIVKPEAVSHLVQSPHHFEPIEGGGYFNGDAQSLVYQNSDLHLDGSIHNQLIRINHYVMRDEEFFRNVKIVRAIELDMGGAPVVERLTYEHYDEFNRGYDDEIMRFIMQKHPDMYRSFWEKRL